jgi:cytochrome P450
MLLWIAGANTDSAMFPEPTEFCPFRAPNPHLSFGAGPHHCLGFPLARMELEECVRAILTSWHRLALTGAPQRFNSNVVNEYLTLPISVDLLPFEERS